MEQLLARVHGLVQGVNFRSSTAIRALELGLVGYVRNLPDGTVEALAEGQRETLEIFLAFLQDGPPAARVTSVEAVWLPATGSFSGFSIRY
jgi:acylphosphatase